ncbi:hypothetical protein [Phascolarctobacterium sp. ET69]|nr:hypothetical protein [Phascolarctobacterium sp. ET69]
MMEKKQQQCFQKAAGRCEAAAACSKFRSGDAGDESAGQRPIQRY